MPNIIDFIFPEIQEWKKTKQILENGLIGEILSVNVDWNFFSYDLQHNIDSWKTDVTKGGGALSFYFSHVFHYLEYFLGKIENLQCNLFFSNHNQNSAETGVDMSILFANGCKGHAQMDISGKDVPKHQIEFLGKNGSMILKNTSSNFVENFEITVKTAHGIQHIQLPKSSLNTFEDSRVKVVLPIAKRFIDWCNTGVASKPDFEDGMRVQELIELARNSFSNENYEQFSKNR